MLKNLDLSDDAIWKKRYRTPMVMWSRIAKQNSKRGVVCTNRDGIYQLYAWDVETGELQQRSNQAVGVIFGNISADGNTIYYLQDEQGDELGHFVRVPFEGGEPEDISPDLPRYAGFQVSESASGNCLGFIAAVRGEGFTAYVKNTSGQVIFSKNFDASTNNLILSYDGSIVTINSNEHTGTTDYKIKAFDVASGELIGELWDGEGSSMGRESAGFFPIAGDERLIANTNKSGYSRPVIWHPRTGERRDIELPELDGEIFTQDCSHDGRYLLLRQLSQAQVSLYLYDLESDKLLEIEHESGTFSFGYFLPDGRIFVTMQDSQNPSRVVSFDTDTHKMNGTILEAGTTADSIKWRSVHYNSSDGTAIQAWVATPEGEGPFPTIVHTHGGPTAALTEVFSPASQAWLDHGFAFFSINYRGSTTFGAEFQKAINGNLGDLEVEDVAAGVQWLIDEGIAHPDMILKTGGSYGGYMTLQSLGKKPNLWAGGMAVVAIADWVLMYEDQAETLRRYQVSLFGGTPNEKPEAHRKSSPITYVEQIKAPVLVIQGENDTRCPARQMQAYEAKMKEHGKSINIHWFDAGHGSREMEQQIEQQELMMRFAYRVLG